jgi:hypothetical protein
MGFPYFRMLYAAQELGLWSIGQPTLTNLLVEMLCRSLDRPAPGFTVLLNPGIGLFFFLLGLKDFSLWISDFAFRNSSIKILKLWTKLRYVRFLSLVFVGFFAFVVIYQKFQNARFIDVYQDRPFVLSMVAFALFFSVHGGNRS